MLATHDMEATLDFYENKLGWKRSKMSNDALILFDVSGLFIGLYSREALLRWSHPTRGIVEPKDFIALAEEMNLIQAMGV